MRVEIQKEGAEEIVVVDLHGYTLYEVRVNLPYLIAEYVKMGYNHFDVIHGYSTGKVLLQHIRSILPGDLRKVTNIPCKIIGKEKGSTRLYCSYG